MKAAGFIPETLRRTLAIHYAPRRARFMKRNPIWLMEKYAHRRGAPTGRNHGDRGRNLLFRKAIMAQDVEVRKLLGDLAIAEQGHEAKAIEIERKNPLK